MRFTNRARNRCLTICALALIIAAGVGIRCYRLSDRSIWFDEASSWRTIQFPWPEMVGRVARNNHLPLHYVLLKAWVSIFGDSLLAMRALSIVLAGLTILSAYLFASEAFQIGAEPSRWIGLAAALLVAVSLLQIRAAWEARMYTLGTFLVALSSWTLFRALASTRQSAGQDRSSKWWWCLHSVVTLLLAYTHNYALFSIAAQLLFLAGFFLWRSHWSLARVARERAFRGALAAYSVVGLGWALWIPILLRQIHQVQEHWWTGPLSAHHLLSRAYELIFDGLRGEQGGVPGGLVAAGCAATLLALPLLSGPPGEQGERSGASGDIRHAAAWYVVSLAGVPIALGIAASLLGKNIFVLRYLVFAQLFLLIAIAVLVAKLFSNWSRHVALGLLVAGAMAIFIDAMNVEDSPHRPGLRGAVEYIEARRRPGEPVIVSTPVLYFPALYHFQDRSICRLYSDGRPLLHHSGGPIVVPADLIGPEEIERIGAGRVWLICLLHSIEMPIPSDWTLLSERSFPEVFGRHGDPRVLEYEVAP